MKHFFVLYNNYACVIWADEISRHYYLDHDPCMPYPYQYR